jgi:hypothetical protein
MSKTSGGKVTKSCFTPRSRRLADAGHLAVRTTIATKEGFPRTSNIEFAWNLFRQLREQETDDWELLETFQRAELCADMRVCLAKYVCFMNPVATTAGIDFFRPGEARLSCVENLSRKPGPISVLLGFLEHWTGPPLLHKLPGC